MGLILNIISSIIKWFIQPFCYTYGAIESLRRREFNKWNKDLAISKDRYGNVLIKYVANSVLIKTGGYRFGNYNDTISKVLGRNKHQGTLTSIGKFFCYILNILDKNHVEKADK